MSSNFTRRLLATYVRPEWPQVALLGLLLFVGIGLQLANPEIVKLFIDRAQAGQPLEQLVWIALVFIGATLLAQITSVFETYIAENLGWRTTNALRADLTQHVLRLDAAFHAEHGPGELIERIDGDVSAVADFFSRFVVQVLGSGLFLVGMLILLLREDWRIGALMTLFALVAFVFMSRGGGFVAVRSRAARQASADLINEIEERLVGLPDLKSNGADAYTLRRLHERLGARFRAVGSSVMAGSLFNGVVGLLFVLGTGGALALSAALYSNGTISLGSIYVVFRYTAMLRQPLERLTRYMNGFLMAAGGIERIGELLSTRPSILDGPHAAVRNGPLTVQLSNVSFAYDTEPVLQDVTFQLEAGEVLGVLGRTGSGKTTISRLLFRLHDPLAGSVRLGGTDVRSVRLETLRDRIGLVTQDVQLFQATLRDNVALFDRSVSDARLIEVFSELGLAEWVQQLPDGLNTLLGAGGRGLSGGEAQLVALARVFLRDPGLVILDEASSRLDPITERRLDRALARLLEGRTAMIIAHRLPTVERADRILILEGGQIAEFGSRPELECDPESRFARLLQAGIAEVLA